jgi:hypothetical protein
MSFLPRLRQACRPIRSGTGPIAGTQEPTIDLTLPDPNEEANVALLSGTIAEEPLRDRSRDGDTVTVLLLAFPAPDEKVRQGSACCEVEVSDEVAGGRRNHLCIGRRLVVLGRLTGAGGLWASAIVTSAPDSREADQR